MEIRFYIDPETGYPHIHWHGVQEYEVEDVLEQPREDTPGCRNFRIAIGQTKSGRYLQVVYTHDSKTRQILIITAYELKGNALTAYRRRRRRSGR